MGIPLTTKIFLLFLNLNTDVTLVTLRTKKCLDFFSNWNFATILNMGSLCSVAIIYRTNCFHIFLVITTFDITPCIFVANLLEAALFLLCESINFSNSLSKV